MDMWVHRKQALNYSLRSAVPLKQRTTEAQDIILTAYTGWESSSKGLGREYFGFGSLFRFWNICKCKSVKKRGPTPKIISVSHLCLVLTAGMDTHNTLSPPEFLPAVQFLVSAQKRSDMGTFQVFRSSVFNQYFNYHPHIDSQKVFFFQFSTPAANVLLSIWYMRKWSLLMQTLW